MDHLAIARRNFPSDSPVALKHKDRAATARQGRGRGQPHGARPNHQSIDALALRHGQPGDSLGDPVESPVSRSCNFFPRRSRKKRRRVISDPQIRTYTESPR